MNSDGKKLYAIMQDALQNEAGHIRNLRLVEFDAGTGKSTAQYAYPLDLEADLHLHSVSSITSIGNNRFLVIERENRGTGTDPASKRVYLVDITGATDISQLRIEERSGLPADVIPVSKSLYVDVPSALTAAGLPVTEKLEGLTIGSQLAEGTYLMVFGKENDYRVTQTGSGMQLDVRIDSRGSGTQIPVDSGCPPGNNLVSGFLYSCGADDLDWVAPAVPEPASWTLFGAGILSWAALRQRRQDRANDN